MRNSTLIRAFFSLQRFSTPLAVEFQTCRLCGEGAAGWTSGRAFGTTCGWCPSRPDRRRETIKNNLGQTRNSYTLVLPPIRIILLFTSFERHLNEGKPIISVFFAGVIDTKGLVNEHRIKNHQAPDVAKHHHPAR